MNNYKRLPAPFEAISFENTYTDDELKEIWKELDYYTCTKAFMPPEETASAKKEDGSLLKKNKGIFLQQIYNQLEKSSIIRYTANKIFDPQTLDFFKSVNPVHETLGGINQLSTLISYYEDQDFYDYHHDTAVYTMVTYLFKEPKMFTGGNISFKINEKEHTHYIKNNMSVIFPSIYRHKVDTIVMNEKIEPDSGFGRYCISTFCTIIF